MLTRIAGLIVAGGIIAASASSADAQVAIQLGNPYTGSGITIGNPGYNYGYGNYGYGNYGNYGYAAPVTSLYSSGYTGYGTYGYAPAATVYSSGYTGYAAPVTTYATQTYVAPAYGYRTYGYPAYGYGGYGYRGYGYGRGYGGLLRRFR